MSSEMDMYTLSYFPNCHRHFYLNVCNKSMMVFSVVLVRYLLSKIIFLEDKCSVLFVSFFDKEYSVQVYT